MRDTLRNWPRPEFELYDPQADRWEHQNLAGDPRYKETEGELRHRLQSRLSETNDPILNGVVPAPPGY